MFSSQPAFNFFFTLRKQIFYSYLSSFWMFLDLSMVLSPKFSLNISSVYSQKDTQKKKKKIKQEPGTPMKIKQKEIFCDHIPTTFPKPNCTIKGYLQQQKCHSTPKYNNNGKHFIIRSHFKHMKIYKIKK